MEIVTRQSLHERSLVARVEIGGPNKDQPNQVTTVTSQPQHFTLAEEISIRGR